MTPKDIDKNRLQKKDQLVLMDGGTTNFFIVEQLPKDTHATIVTNSPPLALTLNDHPHNKRFIMVLT
jgi:DeoR/GlpR family transcriptional regulator of sugar metabolism